MAYSMRKGVLVSRADDDTVILDPDSGKYYGLNPTAGAMLRVLLESKDEEDALSRLEGLYEVERERLKADFRAFIEGMEARSLFAPARE